MKSIQKQSAPLRRYSIESHFIATTSQSAQNTILYPQKTILKSKTTPNQRTNSSIYAHPCGCALMTGVYPNHTITRRFAMFSRAFWCLRDQRGGRWCVWCVVCCRVTVTRQACWPIASPIKKPNIETQLRTLG